MITNIEFLDVLNYLNCKEYSIERGMFKWIFAQIVVEKYMNLVESVLTVVRGLQEITRTCPQPQKHAWKKRKFIRRIRD